MWAIRRCSGSISSPHHAGSGLVDRHGKYGWDTSWVTPQDPLRRVSEFLSQPFTFDSFYTYDKVGNRTDLGRHAIAGDRLDTFNGNSLFYDADGDLIKRRHGGADTQRLYWNSMNQLLAVWSSGGDSVTFAYDGFGRRIRKTTSAGTVRYVWDGENVLAEVDGSGVHLAEYTYYPGVDRPNSMLLNGPSGATYYFAQDIPGNVVAVFDTLRTFGLYRGGHKPKTSVQESRISIPLCTL
jgi:YD repeat-containing protein